MRACVHSVGMLCGYMPNSSLSLFYIYINFCTAPTVYVVIGALEIYDDDDDDDDDDHLTMKLK